MLSRLRIGPRLVLSYLVLSTLVWIAGGLGLYYMDAVGAEGIAVGEELAPLGDAAMEIKLSATNAHLLFEEILSGDTTEDPEEAFGLLDEATWYCDAILEGAENDEGTFIATEKKEVRAKIVEVKASLARFATLARGRLKQQQKEGGSGAGSDADVAFDKEFDHFVQAADDVEEMLHADMIQGLDDLRAHRSQAQTTLLAAMIVAVLFALVIGIVVARSIARPIVAASQMSARIAGGDLASSAKGDLEDGRRDEIGVMQRAFGGMTNGWRQVVASLQEGVAQLTSSTAEIGATAKQASVTASQQSTTAIEVSTTMDELRGTSQRTAASAQQVVESSDSASTAGRHGIEAVDHAVAAMDAIERRAAGIADEIRKLNARNQQIGQIVQTVSELADRSDLLAVNANIEAARAGEHGRAFRIVAGEVRKLAEQSKRATDQIRTIVGEFEAASNSAVAATEAGAVQTASGKEAISSVRSVIAELSTTLEHSAALAREISGGAADQARIIVDVTEATSQLATAGRETAAGAANLEQSVINLDALASSLMELASRYRV